MQTSQPLTRRIVPALAVTLVATLVLGAVVVTADAATDDAPLVPAHFGVAEPMQGDAWRYNVTLAGDWTFGLDDEVPLGEPVPFATYQWGGAGRVRGGDGLVHDANYFHVDGLSYRPLWIEEHVNATAGPLPVPQLYHAAGDVQLGPSQSPYWVSGESGEWLAAGGKHVLSRGERVAENESHTEYGIPQSGLMQGYSDWYREHGVVQYPVDESPCMLFNPLQGGNLSLAEGLELFGPCRLAGDFLALPAGLSFRAAAVDEVAGVQAVRFDARHNGTYQVWFTPAVPYPVRIAFELPSQRPAELEAGMRDLPGARSAVVEMVGFVAGNTTVNALDATSDAAPELAFAPPLTVTSSLGTTRIGMDETGLEHPFPLSEAMRAAVNDTTGFQDAKTFLQHYPDAYVAYASFVEGTDVSPAVTSAFPGEYSHLWTIVLSSGQETLAFTVARQDQAATLPLVARDLLADSAPAPPLYQFDQGAPYRYYGPYAPYSMEDGRTPYPGSVPQQMPTAVSLAARWAAFDGSGTPMNNYGFAIGCAPNGDERDDACHVRVELFAGHARYSDANPAMQGFPVPTDPYGNEVHMRIERLVLFRDDGRALALLVEDEREYQSSSNTPTGVGGGLPPPTAVQEPGYDLQSTAVNGIPSSATKWIPAPEEAAGVGFLGLVVGFLYWIWPKLGVAALFSRLERGELLDHPARARLVQIVESQPGIHFHDLAQKAELANGTAVHHLRKLSDSGLVSVRRSGRYTCYFPGGRVDPHQAAAAPLLKSEGAKQVLEAVKARPGMSNLEVAQATGLQPSTVNYHVQRLSQAGLVAALRDGRMVRLHPGARMGSATGTDAPAAASAA